MSEEYVEEGGLYRRVVTSEEYLENGRRALRALGKLFIAPELLVTVQNGGSMLYFSRLLRKQINNKSKPNKQKPGEGDSV